MSKQDEFNNIDQFKQDKKKLEYEIMGKLNQFQNKYWVDIDGIDLEQIDATSVMDPCKRILTGVKIKIDFT